MVTSALAVKGIPRIEQTPYSPAQLTSPLPARLLAATSLRSAPRRHRQSLPCMGWVAHPPDPLGGSPPRPSLSCLSLSDPHHEINTLLHAPLDWGARSGRGGYRGNAEAPMDTVNRWVEGAVLTVAIVGVHVEVWNLPAVDAGIRPPTVAALTVAAHGHCQHRAPAGCTGGGGAMKHSISPLPRPSAWDLQVLCQIFQGWPKGIQHLGLWLSSPQACLPRSPQARFQLQRLG